ncbi:hypothetical protein FNH04_21660 [Streptomyces phyllanthi]|uniref:Uncharacterized protein n=1 Tax=Streptomyces phyllanthi TaxID=1803180 RepID=A0A5N8W686_9ACTN|nr:hypothetical protein [Streptomyces phyllanthi]
MYLRNQEFDPQGRSLPNYVALDKQYDADRMRSELADLSSRSGISLSAASGRRVVPLRNIGGDAYRTDSGGPSLLGFQDTPWISHLPYFRQILEELPAPVRAARLWAVGPGTRDMTLQSAKMGPPWGLCRVHLPVTGSPGARAVFFGEHWHWPPGTLWFAAAWREYALANSDSSDLVHLIVDLCHTSELGNLFPSELRKKLAGRHALRLRPAIPLLESDAAKYRCSFDLPESFSNWETPGYRILSEKSGVTVPAEIEFPSGAPVLKLAGRPFAALEYLGEGEFRLQGWSDERTIQVREPAPATVLLHLREGTAAYTVDCPAVQRHST